MQGATDVSRAYLIIIHSIWWLYGLHLTEQLLEREQSTEHRVRGSRLFRGLQQKVEHGVHTKAVQTKIIIIIIS